MMAGITPKQAVFVAAYIGEAKHNATEAARIAGYKQPGQLGHVLLKKVEIAEAIEAHLVEVKARGIADKQNRIDALVDRHERMRRVIAERAADPLVADVPGGSTGLIVKQLKSVKHVYQPDPDAEDGRTQQVAVETWEAAVDTGLLREMREHEKQVAQEMGEWVDKSESAISASGSLVIRSISVPLPTREDGGE